MFALLKKLRGPSQMARLKLDDKAWNQLHNHTEVKGRSMHSFDVLNSKGPRPRTDISSGFEIPLAF